MAKKKANPELLVAEIHIQQSKIASLSNQFNANKAKIDRLSSTNLNIKNKADRLKETLQRNIKLAQELGIRF